MTAGAARAVVVQVAASDPPGALGEWLPAAGLGLDVIRPYDGDPVPRTVDGAALVVLGGEMSAYDDERAPWLPAVRDLLRAAVSDGVPTLGICLGAQLMAAACGGRVQVGDPAGPEIGVCSVTLAPAAGEDPLLRGLPTVVPAVQWHFDGVAQPPPGAIVLAASPSYAHQAFRLGAHAWALQWHPEVTPEMMRSWAAADDGVLAELGLRGRDVVAAVSTRQPELTATWESVVARFAGLAIGRR